MADGGEAICEKICIICVICGLNNDIYTIYYMIVLYSNETTRQTMERKQK